MKNIIVVTGASSGMGKEFLVQILEKESNIDEVWAIARDEKKLIELNEKVIKKIMSILLAMRPYLKKDKYLFLAIMISSLIMVNYIIKKRYHIVLLLKK